jgi:DNA-directed RNA polymerase subunit M/transcription elongation factor TFIIS
VWSLKKCPRCRGDVFIDKDTETSYEKCLQCGYEREAAETGVNPKSRVSEKEKSGVK